MSTHTIRITKVDRAEDHDTDFDEVEWEVESCSDCHLWIECEECRVIYDKDTLHGMVYDSPDYPTLELHGITHRIEEGFVVKDVEGCGLVLMDGGNEAVQDEIYRHQMKAHRFSVGELLTAEADYEGDGFWTVDLTLTVSEYPECDADLARVSHGASRAGWSTLTGSIALGPSEPDATVSNHSLTLSLPRPCAVETCSAVAATWYGLDVCERHSPDALQRR